MMFKDGPQQPQAYVSPAQRPQKKARILRLVAFAEVLKLGSFEPDQPASGHVTTPNQLPWPRGCDDVISWAWCPTWHDRGTGPPRTIGHIEELDLLTTKPS